MYRKDLYHLDIAMGNFVFLLDIAVPKMAVTVIPTYFVLFTMLTYSALSTETPSKTDSVSVETQESNQDSNFFKTDSRAVTLLNQVTSQGHSQPELLKGLPKTNKYKQTSFEIVIKLEKMKLVKQPLIICHFCGNHQIV